MSIFVYQTPKQIKKPIICATFHPAGGDTEGWSVCVLVCAVFGDTGARGQHQPDEPGGPAEDTS